MATARRDLDTKPVCDGQLWVGVRSALAIEGCAIVVFGLLLFWFWHK